MLHDPLILSLARSVRQAEGREADPTKERAADAEFAKGIRQKQRTDHIRSLFANARGNDADLSTYQLRHRAYENEATPDKTHFFQRNFNSDYNEAIAKQKHILAEKR